MYDCLCINGLTTLSTHGFLLIRRLAICSSYKTKIGPNRRLCRTRLRYQILYYLQCLSFGRLATALQYLSYVILLGVLCNTNDVTTQYQLFSLLVNMISIWKKYLNNRLSPNSKIAILYNRVMKAQEQIKLTLSLLSLHFHSHEDSKVSGCTINEEETKMV